MSIIDGDNATEGEWGVAPPLPTSPLPSLDERCGMLSLQDEASGESQAYLNPQQLRQKHRIVIHRAGLSSVDNLRGSISAFQTFKNAPAGPKARLINGHESGLDVSTPPSSPHSALPTQLWSTHHGRCPVIARYASLQPGELSGRDTAPGSSSAAEGRAAGSSSGGGRMVFGCASPYGVPGSSSSMSMHSMAAAAVAAASSGWSGFAGLIRKDISGARSMVSLSRPLPRAQTFLGDLSQNTRRNSSATGEGDADMQQTSCREGAAMCQTALEGGAAMRQPTPGGTDVRFASGGRHMQQKQQHLLKATASAQARELEQQLQWKELQQELAGWGGRPQSQRPFVTKRSKGYGQQKACLIVKKESSAVPSQEGLFRRRFAGPLFSTSEEPGTGLERYAVKSVARMVWSPNTRSLVTDARLVAPVVVPAAAAAAAAAGLTRFSSMDLPGLPLTVNIPNGDGGGAGVGSLSGLRRPGSLPGSPGMVKRGHGSYPGLLSGDGVMGEWGILSGSPGAASRGGCRFGSSLPVSPVAAAASSQPSSSPGGNAVRSVSVPAPLAPGSPGKGFDPSSMFRRAKSPKPGVDVTQSDDLDVELSAMETGAAVCAAGSSSPGCREEVPGTPLKSPLAACSTPMGQYGLHAFVNSGDPRLG